MFSKIMEDLGNDINIHAVFAAAGNDEKLNATQFAEIQAKGLMSLVLIFYGCYNTTGRLKKAEWQAIGEQDPGAVINAADFNAALFNAIMIKVLAVYAEQPAECEVEIDSERLNAWAKSFRVIKSGNPEIRKSGN